MDNVIEGPFKRSTHWRVRVLNTPASMASPGMSCQCQGSGTYALYSESEWE
jgi:hypothetical protein